MDFNAIFQLKTKKFWWMDVLFYFAMSLLVAAIICYLIFLTKNIFQRQDIKNETAKLQTVGTDDQKQQEQTVLLYQKKINDFSTLFKNHEFASQVFAFMEQETMPNVWFKKFDLDEKNATISLSGEADNQDAFSRQVAVFEGNKYVQNINLLNSTTGNSSKIEFNLDINLSPEIFNYTITQTNAN